MEEFQKKDNEEADPIPEKEEAVQFWSEIWDKPISHNHEASWLEDVENKIGNIEKQNEIKETLLKNPYARRSLRDLIKLACLTLSIIAS